MLCPKNKVGLGQKWAISNFGPIPWQAVEIIGGLLATESQTSKGTQYTGG